MGGGSMRSVESIIEILPGTKGGWAFPRSRPETTGKMGLCTDFLKLMGSSIMSCIRSVRSTVGILTAAACSVQRPGIAPWAIPSCVPGSRDDRLS